MSEESTGTLEQPASGSTFSAESPVAGISAAFADIAAQNDPDFKAMIDGDKADRNNEKNTAEADPVPEGAEIPADSDKSDENQESAAEKSTVTDEKNSGEESLDDLEFADDVIEGVKGEELKKLTPAALEKLAEHVERSKGLSSELTQIKERLKLLDDPIIKQREEMLRSGKTAYPMREISEVEKQTAIQRLQKKLDLTLEEATEAYHELEGGFKSAAKEMAEDFIHNRTLEVEQKNQIDATISKGRQTFLNLGKFNKDLAFKETDPNKFWVRNSQGQWELNEKHPEIRKYQEKVFPVMSALAKAGMDYGTVTKLSESFGDEAVYALAAKKLGLPSAINTGDRDRKMVASELRKKLAPFLKGATKGELSAEGNTSSASRTPSQKAAIKGGYEITKLANDPDYYERAIKEKATPEHAKKIMALAEEGEVYLANMKKRKN